MCGQVGQGWASSARPLSFPAAHRLLPSPRPGPHPLSSGFWGPPGGRVCPKALPWADSRGVENCPQVSPTAEAPETSETPSFPGEQPGWDPVQGQEGEPVVHELHLLPCPYSNMPSPGTSFSSTK